MSWGLHSPITELGVGLAEFGFELFLEFDEVPDPLGTMLLEFGTKVTSVDRVGVRVSGVHTNGWWVGDGIEDFFVGNLGANLWLYLFVGGDIPGLAREGWYEGSVVLTNDGVFAVSFSLSPHLAYLVSVPYIPAGRIALSCVVSPQYGWGSFAREPYLALSQVEIELEAKPVMQINSFTPDGLLTWSALPAGGTIEVLSATDPGGAWAVEVRLPSERRSTMLQSQAAAPRFYRLRWLEGATP